jgi:hypothetical protein
MERTFAGCVAELEEAVRPLGFKIRDAEYSNKKLPVFGSSGLISEGENELLITIALDKRLD